jgi:hypothetical protein
MFEKENAGQVSLLTVPTKESQRRLNYALRVVGYGYSIRPAFYKARFQSCKSSDSRGNSIAIVTNSSFLFASDGKER